MQLHSFENPEQEYGSERTEAPGSKQLSLQLVSGPATGRRRALTVVIPCFNEKDTILSVLDSVRALAVDALVVVVDNCSTDGTRERLVALCDHVPDAVDELGPGARELLDTGRRLMRGDGFWLVLQPRNMQKGDSVRRGLAIANSHYVICQDADLEYDPNDIPRLLAYADEHGCCAVFGSRLTGSTGAIGHGAYHFGRVVLSRFFSLLYGARVTDVATCYKLLRTDVARRVNRAASGFDADFEIAARLRRNGHAIAEVPIRYCPRDVADGKKIRWWHGLSAIWTMIRWRFGAVNDVEPTSPVQETEQACAQ